MDKAFALWNCLYAFKKVVGGRFAHIERSPPVKAMFGFLFLDVRHREIPHCRPVELSCAHGLPFLSQKLESLNHLIYTVPTRIVISNWNIPKDLLNFITLFNLSYANTDKEHLRSDKRNFLLLKLPSYRSILFQSFLSVKALPSAL